MVVGTVRANDLVDLHHWPRRTKNRFVSLVHFLLNDVGGEKSVQIAF